MDLCKSILVVDDNEDIRETLRDIFAGEGYIVDEASDGKMALEKLKTMPAPVLVFLDLMMPVMNGWEFLDEQKRTNGVADNRIITLSAVAATQSLEDPAPLENVGVISKPVSWEKLWSTVNSYCEAKNSDSVPA